MPEVVDLTAGSELVCRFNTLAGTITLPVFVKLSFAREVPSHVQSVAGRLMTHEIRVELQPMGAPLE